ncbi:butyrate kinase [Neobacillus piezotolerans]|uniref:Probable butyrate kinase n=1 Tax=Neobacillus piezotolerans TaxID=2259171 RepID=A0A3D8GR23_9BACI|nr:butyrate kinase [Neobacillus piezotolerans]RDU36731.1 butyrate kinase [Neobacillus piezotolerans]
MAHYILAINPGSTSTKLGIYEDRKLLFTETVRHADEDLAGFSKIADQLPLRLQVVAEFFEKHGFDARRLAAVAGRGGLLKPMNGGTYMVSEDMLSDATSGIFGEHASNLGPVLAFEIASKFEIPAYIVDPVTVDEFIPESRLSGFSGIDRISQLHALNIKAVSRKVARGLGRPLEELNFVVAHLGAGISVAAGLGGRIIDVNNADNEGPFSPERSGTLPLKQLIRLCYSGKYTEKEVVGLVTRKGGLCSYLGTKSAHEAEKRAISGDFHAELVLNAMVHQIAKEIGAMAAVLDGRVDGIILTGGLAHSEYIVGKLRKKIGFLGEVFVLPGEEELEALAEGALRVLNGEEAKREYSCLLD